MTRSYYVYILSNGPAVLYTGVTSDIVRRVAEHKAGSIPGFTSKYKIDRLVFVEETDDVYAALTREKQIKAWTRQKRIALINSMNPSWRDLSEDWAEKQP